MQNASPEMQRVFVDTSILVYADDVADTQRRQQVRAWLAHLWATRTGRTSTQVLNELRRQMHASIVGGNPVNRMQLPQ